VEGRWKNIVSALILLSFAGCGNTGGDRLITQNRVGNITFDQDIPNMGKGYVTRRDTMYTDDEGFPYFAVEDKAGNLALKVFQGESIEVFSPEFKTEAGIRPGMNLHEAAEIAGSENLHIWLGWPDNYFTIEDSGTGFTWSVYGDQINGGRDAFLQFSMSGTGRVTLADFAPGAVIGWITVIDYDNED